MEACSMALSWQVAPGGGGFDGAQHPMQQEALPVLLKHWGRGRATGGVRVTHTFVWHARRQKWNGC